MNILHQPKVTEVKLDGDLSSCK